MTVLFYLFLIVLLCYGLYMFAGQELMLLNLMIIGLMLFFAWKGYQEFHELTSLWADITTWGVTAWAHAVASWKDFFGGMATALSWMGFGLGVIIMLVIGAGIIWPLDKRWAERRAQGKIDQAEASAAEARRQAEEERRKRIEAERAKQGSQTIVANVKRDNVDLSRQVGRDRGQRISAVGELKRRRKREDKLRQQLAAAQREIERLRRALPLESQAQ